jgi:hypothetical protein
VLELVSILVLLLFINPLLISRALSFLSNEPFAGMVLVVDKNITTISVAEILVRDIIIK